MILKEKAQMQYYRPGGKHFVGDCMPFSHAGRYHLFYCNCLPPHRRIMMY